MNTNRDKDKVIDHTRLQLSALFDGELGLDEARFLQRRLAHDGELLAAWSRWQLAGDVLRGQAVAAAPAGFADRVAASLAAESAPAAARPDRRRSRLLPGAALAASVAALAMFMTRQAPEVSVPAAPAMEIASAAGSVPTRAPAQPEPAPAPPAAPAAPDTALQVAGTAIAVAEVPRRAAERRSRAQQQRAAATRTERNAPEPRLVAAASAPPAPAAVAAVETPANPFLPEAAAEVVASRPWPRALLPADGGAFTVGYGRLHTGAADPHPFQPRPVDLSRTANEDTD